MIQAVLFDLDGTLLDTSDDLGAALNHVLAANKMPTVGKQVYSSAISNGVAAMLQVGFGESLKHYDTQVLRQGVLDYYLENLSVHSQCFAQIGELLAALVEKEVQVGIMTNKPEFLTLPLLKQIPELAKIETVVCGDTLAVAKPHPEPLLLVASKLGVSPTRCIYVGDAERDIVAAKSAKMISAAAMWGFIPSEAEAKSWHADLYLTNPLDTLSHI
ncbi:HAD family hydrolase [Pseudoalteromonas piscicida]|uniref:HAD family hydrolase n=1 Tax=Pseudoalteromonas piscicida TaxID=43662 RepID=A0AAD0W4R0_PSEO7|nr:HAD-IA family hydrolase [Pseudoalteromonas piscicida]ASD66963.1 haloacid dehalogenase [Pseudoalteromonas piscicida]AXQ97886.1 HAD family hydrolase [Pseudoalteromonas piscicida]AXR02328.1 HAD family hydrolase [Pseudoalteromonas piscicida]